MFDWNELEEIVNRTKNEKVANQNSKISLTHFQDAKNTRFDDVKKPIIEEINTERGQIKVSNDNDIQT
ncbi:MAG: hypothetical protein MHPSP_002034, partial [Paramarteilia canceri]